MTPPRKITPCLWFNYNAEEAVAHYMAIFKQGRIVDKVSYGDGMPNLKGRALSIRFEIEGQEFNALNGGPNYPFTEAISLSVDCEDQSEIDRLWSKLCDGGSPGRCGWLKDKFGVSWQVVPRELTTMLKDPDPMKVARVMQVMITMTKITISELRQAYGSW